MKHNNNHQNGHVPVEELSLAPELEQKLKAEEEVERKNRERRNRKPLLLCQAIVTYPKLAFCK